MSHEAIFQEARKHHDPSFDDSVQRTHDFTVTHLGLHPVATDRIAVITGDDQKLVRQFTGAAPSYRGGFNKEANGIVLFPVADKANPTGATVRAESDMVHELTHSATDNQYHHIFFREALAGIGEAKFLEFIGKFGHWKPTIDFTLRRSGVELVVPGNFRYYDSSTANTSQGLIAGLGMAYGMRAAGTRVVDIMQGSSLNGERQYSMMKSGLNSLQKGLSKEVETFPETTDGIIQATAVIQDVAKRRQAN